jgi:hypothetical protein
MTKTLTVSNFQHTHRRQRQFRSAPFENNSQKERSSSKLQDFSKTQTKSKGQSFLNPDHGGREGSFSREGDQGPGQQDRRPSQQRQQRHFIKR